VSTETTVALVTTGGSIVVAGMAFLSTRSVRRAKQKTDANEAKLEEKKFSMDFWERRAKVAQEDAERWETEYREEHAANIALDKVNDHLSRDRKRLLRELERIYSDHPQLEEIYRQRYKDEE
jgi:uncharacterized membrane protein YgaE (UPF0421/DUF939 family)